MNIAENAIRQKTVSWTVIVLLIVGGIFSFNGLGRLEDPAFTIKKAMITTYYPGASSIEVEEEVTLPIEDVLQQLPYLDNVTSTSNSGMSQIMVEMKSTYRKDDLMQIWDELRSKISDVQKQLPPGSVAPIVNTEFGDVFGYFLAVSGKGYSYADIKDYVDYLKRELVLVEGVGKVNIGGVRSEELVLEINRTDMTALGLSTASLQSLLQTQNLVSNAGNVRVGTEYIRISSTGTISSIDALKNLVVGRNSNQLIYLSDIANISQVFVDPSSHIYRFNDQEALTLGISFSGGVDVVEVGKAIKGRLGELEFARPIGIEIGVIYDQPSMVDASVANFVKSLFQAVGIVILVLLLSMGLRAGILMSVVLSLEHSLL